jgi:hypothetical protein
VGVLPTSKNLLAHSLTLGTNLDWTSRILRNQRETFYRVVSADAINVEGRRASDTVASYYPHDDVKLVFAYFTLPILSSRCEQTKAS